jgi:predicted GIY-YIG superfamily endonuclease
MYSQPKTIQIYLPKGDARSIRLAEITSRIVQAIEIPRSLLNEFFAMPECKQVGIYFLFGQTEESSTPLAYIGQSSNLEKRLASHNREKDFWERAIVLITKTQNFTQTHALFLEWFCIQRTKDVARYKLSNGNAGSKPYITPPLEADCLEIFDTGRILLSTLGYPIFEPLLESQEAKSTDLELFYCSGEATNAIGQYTEEGFVVIKGSIGRAQGTPSFQNHSFNKKKNALLAEGKIAIENGVLIFKENVLFTSPSSAAGIALGRSANGWEEWKNINGQTLDSLKRLVP